MRGDVEEGPLDDCSVDISQNLTMQKAPRNENGILLDPILKIEEQISSDMLRSRLVS